MVDAWSGAWSELIMDNKIISTNDQRAILTAVRTLCHGLPPAEKSARLHVLMLGVVVALGATGSCPPDWALQVMNNTVEKLFRKRPTV